MIMTRKRLVVLASGNGGNLEAILVACEQGDLPAEVVAVVSDHKTAFAIERAKQHAIPAVYHPWKRYGDNGGSRQEYDTDLAEIVSNYQPDYIVLAGWMRLLTLSFINRFPMRVINLHPALPGTFPGTHAIQRAFEAFLVGEINQTGVMVHFVPDEGVDDGPIILHETVPIHQDDTLVDLEKRIHNVEHRLLVDALHKVFQNEH
jgi:phosphoribosylglycinamide formyltransferase-1